MIHILSSPFLLELSPARDPLAQTVDASPSPDRSSTGIGKSRGVSQGLRAQGGLQVHIRLCGDLHMDIRLSSYLLVHVGHNLARGTHGKGTEDQELHAGADYLIPWRQLPC